MRPHRWQPTRLPRPWGSPGKNTGVVYHFLLQCTKVKSESEVTQLCPTLHDPWTAAYQAPPSMGFPRQEYWSGVPLPSPYLSLILSKFRFIKEMVQKTKIMASGPITPWQIDGETMTLFSWAPKSLKTVTTAMKLKGTCSLQEKL